MRSFSFKKILWAGLFSLLALWVIYKLGKMFYNFPSPLRNLLYLIIPKHIPGLEFVAVFIIIMIFGIIALYLSNLASSKIPFIKQIIKFSKIAHDLSTQVEKGELKSVLVKIAEGVYRPGYTRNEIQKIDDQELIKVFLPNTPNPTTGQTHLVAKEELIYLSKESNKPMLKTITLGGLLK